MRILKRCGILTGTELGYNIGQYVTCRAGVGPAPMSRGRKLLPGGFPRSPQAQFAWLVRAIRASHYDDDIRTTKVFRHRLVAEEGETPLAVDTINKLETAQLPFTIERCLQFERALGLQEGVLVDVYCYLHRIFDQTPKGALFTPQEASSVHLESILKIGQDERLQPLDWLRLAGLYRRRPDLFLSLRESVAAGFFRDLAQSYERDERILLEAAVHLRPLLAPFLTDAIKSNPSHLFNLVESLGHSADATSLRAVEEIADFISDDLVAPMILESIVRSRKTVPGLPLSRSTEGDLLNYALDSISSGGKFYCAQEESLALIHSMPRLTASQRKRLSSRNVDLRQLLPMPTACSRQDLIQSIVGKLEQQAVLSSYSTGNAPQLLPGMSEIVVDGLLLPTRRLRLSIAVMLAPWVGRVHITEVVGGMLQAGVEREDYGIRRAAIRLITKLEHPERAKYLARASFDAGLDEGSRCVLAWALGGIRGASAVSAVSHLYDPSSLVSTKRVLLIAAGRQRNDELVRKLMIDPQADIAGHARALLANLSPRGHGQESDY